TFYENTQVTTMSCAKFYYDNRPYILFDFCLEDFELVESQFLDEYTFYENTQVTTISCAKFYYDNRPYILFNFCLVDLELVESQFS
ncbi:4135_t:CDS:2, partial [Racocetra persica]